MATPKLSTSVTSPLFSGAIAVRVSDSKGSLSQLALDFIKPNFVWVICSLAKRVGFSQSLPESLHIAATNSLYYVCNNGSAPFTPCACFTHRLCLLSERAKRQHALVLLEPSQQSASVSRVPQHLPRLILGQMLVFDELLPVCAVCTFALLGHLLLCEFLSHQLLGPLRVRRAKVRFCRMCLPSEASPAPSAAVSSRDDPRSDRWHPPPLWARVSIAA